MTEGQKYVIRDLRREVVALQRERDDARAELSKHVGELAECRRLLREAMQSKYKDADGHVRWSMTAQWLLDAAQAAGGNDATTDNG